MKLIKHPNVVQLYEVFLFLSFCSMLIYVWKWSSENVHIYWINEKKLKVQPGWVQKRGDGWVVVGASCIGEGLKFQLDWIVVAIQLGPWKHTVKKKKKIHVPGKWMTHADTLVHSLNQVLSNLKWWLAVLYFCNFLFIQALEYMGAIIQSRLNFTHPQPMISPFTFPLRSWFGVDPDGPIKISHLLNKCWWCMLMCNSIFVDFVIQIYILLFINFDR